MYYKSKLHMESKEKRKLPLLQSDEKWLSIYEDIKDEKIEHLKKIIEQLIFSEKEARKQYSEITNNKKRVIHNIFQLSDNINNNQKLSDVELLDLEKQKLEQLNYELDDVQFQIESIPSKIREMNFQLLEATIEYSYNELNRRDQELHLINQEMIDIRSRLKFLFEQRLAHEEWNEKVYVYLHSMLGPKVIQKIDDENWNDINE